MEISLYLLKIAVLSPLAFSIFLVFVKDNFKNEKPIKIISLIGSLISLICIIFYALSLDNNFSSFIPNLSQNNLNAFEGMNGFTDKVFNFSSQIDNLSYVMIVLTCFVFCIAIFSCFNSVKYQVKKYMILILVLETICISFFLASNLLSFYILFEAGLIPMFLMIGIWGGEDKVYASIKFFLYTFAGSLFLLGAIIFLYIKFNTLDIQYLINSTKTLDKKTQIILWICFVIPFAIKLPSFPFHTWLPDAHVQAPTSASVILAAILIKMGGYGLLKFVIPALPDANAVFKNYAISIGIISIIYGAFVAMNQNDIKKMIAYSSISHMGYVTIGIFSGNKIGINAAIFQMISHGIVSSGLFLSVGVLYERLHTKKFAELGGCAAKMPSFSFYLMILVLSSVGLPATSGFIGEFSTIVSVFSSSIFFSIFASLGVIFGCVYMLFLYRRAMFGKITNFKINYITDLNIVEKINFLSLSVITIILGVYPSLIYNFF